MAAAKKTTTKKATTTTKVEKVVVHKFAFKAYDCYGDSSSSPTKVIEALSEKRGKNDVIKFVDPEEYNPAYGDGVIGVIPTETLRNLVKELDTIDS